MAEPLDLADALQIVQAAGYVTLREKSYRQAQERQRVAEALRRYADEDAERARDWAREHCAEERRLRDRLTYVYGVAMARGATREELALSVEAIGTEGGSDWVDPHPDDEDPDTAYQAEGRGQP
jgi:hypothetical protein